MCDVFDSVRKKKRSGRAGLHAEEDPPKHLMLHREKHVSLSYTCAKPFSTPPPHTPDHVTVFLFFPIRLCFTAKRGGVSCRGGAKRGAFDCVLADSSVKAKRELKKNA